MTIQVSLISSMPNILALVDKTITMSIGQCFLSRPLDAILALLEKMVSTAACALSATRTLLADTWSITFKVILFAF